MRVSVIIPVRGRHILLGEAVASVANQTYSDVELIVVDDGSSEPVEGEARAAWKRWRDRDDNIKVIRQEATNGNVARNCGIDAATGEFIQFLDSDDLLHPDKLRIQVNQLEAHRTIDTVISHEEFFMEVPGDTRIAWNVDWRGDQYDALDRFCWEEPVWQTSGPLWRRSVFDNGLKWNPALSIWQDWDFHARALFSGIRFERTPSCLVYLREHNQGRSYDLHNQLTRLNNQLRAMESVLEAALVSEKLSEPRRSYLEEVLWKRVDTASGLNSPQAAEIIRKSLELMLRITLSEQRKVIVRLMIRFAYRPKLFHAVASQYQRRASFWGHPEITWKRIILPNREPAPQSLSGNWGKPFAADACSSFVNRS